MHTPEHPDAALSVEGLAAADPAVPEDVKPDARGDDDLDPGISRRGLIRRAGIGGGVVLASGVLASPALAQVGPTTPDPSRTGRDPLSATELATKTYVDARVLKAGDTMSGALLFSGASAPLRRVGTSDALSFDIVTGGTVRIQVASDGAVTFSEAVSAAKTLQVTGKTTVSSMDADGPANFSEKVYLRRGILEADASDPDVDLRAVSKGYVDEQVSGSRGGAGAQGGLRDAEEGVYDEVFFENDLVVSADYTLGTRYDTRTGLLQVDEGTGLPVVLPKNAMSAGPLTISQDATVTIPQGSVWTIV